MNTKSSALIGTARDSVVGLCASNTSIRDYDREEEKKRDELGHVQIDIREEDKDNSERKEGEFVVCCVDESEWVYTFT